MVATSTLAQKVGVLKDEMKTIFFESDLIEKFNRFSFLCVDLTPDSPYPLRISLFKPLELTRHTDGTKEFTLHENHLEYLKTKSEK